MVKRVSIIITEMTIEIKSVRPIDHEAVFFCVFFVFLPWANLSDNIAPCTDCMFTPPSIHIQYMQHVGAQGLSICSEIT